MLHIPPPPPQSVIHTLSTLWIVLIGTIVVSHQPHGVVCCALGEVASFAVVFQRQWSVADTVEIPADGLTSDPSNRRPEAYLGVPLFADVSSMPSAARIGVSDYPPTLPSNTTESYNLPVPIELTLLRRWAGFQIVDDLDAADYHNTWAAVAALSTPRSVASPSRPSDLYSNAYSLMGMVPYALASDGFITVLVQPVVLSDMRTVGPVIYSSSEGSGGSDTSSCVNQTLAGVKMKASLGDLNTSYEETYSSLSYGPICPMPPRRLALGGESDTLGKISVGDYTNETFNENAVFLYIRAYMSTALSREQTDLLTRADSRFRSESQRYQSSTSSSTSNRNDYPTLVTSGALDPASRGAAALSFSEQRSICRIPYVYSHRVSVGKGSTASFKGTSLFSRLGGIPAESAVLLMMVQCSSYALSINYDIAIENAVDGASVTSEYLTLPFLFVALFVLYALAGLVWLGYLLINICFLAKRFPTGVQILVLFTVGMAACASASGLSWSWDIVYNGPAFSSAELTDSGTSGTAFSNPALLFSVGASTFIFVLRPLIAIGWGTFTMQMSLRMRSILLVTTPIFAICALLNNSCVGDGWRSSSAFVIVSETYSGLSSSMCDATYVAYRVLDYLSIIVCWVLVYSSTEASRTRMQNVIDDEAPGSLNQTPTTTTTPANMNPGLRNTFELANSRTAAVENSNNQPDAPPTSRMSRVPGSDCTDHFFRFKSLQMPFLAMIQFPIVSWVADAALLSRRNTLIRVILIEVETFYFIFFCIMYLRHRPVFI